jgi:ADP-dependent phosphofructokinase/glucokinase
MLAMYYRSTALVQEELDKLINLLIDNDEIREIIAQHPDKKHTDKTIVAAAAVSSSKIGMKALH